MRKPMLLAALTVLTACESFLPAIPFTARAPQEVTITEDEVTASSLRLTVVDRRARGEARLIGRNKDVETWAVENAISVSLRQGVLVSTRGLGHDLMGADAQPTLDALDGLAPDVYRRKSRYLTGEHHSTWLNAGCSMVHVGMRGGLRQFDESCQARDFSFTNQFWLDGAGRMLRTRQWVSPQVGYIETELRNP